MLTSQELKQALLSILIGATVAFLSSFFEGVIHILNQIGSDTMGGLAATSTYMLRAIR